MHNKIVKVGVIGVGHLGRHHARNYAQLSTAQLVGIFDTDFNQGNTIATAHQTRLFESVEELLECVDAVSVATPTHTHHAVVKQALEANCHVIVEKPITVTVAEADELIEIATEPEFDSSSRAY